MPPSYYSEELHKRVVGILEDTEVLAAEERDHPVFAFVHVPAPHVPFAFDESGEPFLAPIRRYDEGRDFAPNLTDEQYAAAFAANLRVLNDHVIETIDTILSHPTARGEPMIVVMSDHGYFATPPDSPNAPLHNFFAANGAQLMGDSPTLSDPMRLLGELAEVADSPAARELP